MKSALKLLASQVEAALAVPSRDGKLQRVEIPLDPAIDPLQWLAAQDGSAQYYWSDRSGGYTMAGIGETDVVIPSGPVDYAGLFHYLRRRLPDAMPSLRYYGGFRFHSGPVEGRHWSGFKSFRFVLPRLELVQRSDGSFLSCNMKSGPEKQNRHEWESVQETLREVTDIADHTPPLFPRVLSRKDKPNRMVWEAMIDGALEAFTENTLDKVVLARESTFKGDEPWPALELMQRLVLQTRKSFDFCFRPAPDRAFLGASPERLFKRTNCFLQSEALAGTRPRGKSNEEDRKYAEALLGSEKDLREHRFVVQMLQEQCSRFCSHIEVSEEPHIMRLRDVQHLHTKLEGVLVDPEVDAQLIQALHPTPAVGGVPRDRALKWISENEPFDRGIYAAPVGWVGYDGAEFCVGIRSALIQGKELCVYAGAGIVPGSDAEEEWLEIEAKMGAFRHAIR